jgi:hypothetical protein
VILADSDVSLPRASGRDHVGIAQAASEQENQPLTLTEYRQWGWIEQSARSWAAGAARVDESLVLLTREDGAILAFQGWAAGLGQRGVCPDSPGMDECAASSAGLVARVGRYTFRLAGTGADLGKLASVQAARIRRP